MTITITTNKAQAVGNGGVTAFTYSFPINELSHAQVFLDAHQQASGFTVSGIGNPAGGTVTFATAPAAGRLVTILRVVPLTQEVDYQPYDAFPAETHEGALDKLTKITQQLQEEVDRSWRVPIDTPPGASVAPPPYDAGKVIAWSLTDPNQLINQPGIGTFQEMVDRAENAAAAAEDREIQADISESGASAHAATAGQGAATATTKAAEAVAAAAQAQQSASTASAAAAAASSSEALAASSANQASNSAASASASQGTATQAAIHAQNSKAVAQQWAVNPEDVPVDGGQYSAYHWAQKAAEVVGQGGVGSVFGRSGAVVAMAGDYSVAQITGAASQAAVDSANAAQNAEIALRATITAVNSANAAQDAQIALRATIAAVDAANAAQDAVIAAQDAVIATKAETAYVDGVVSGLQAQIDSLIAELALKAPKASPVFTGDVTTDGDVTGFQP